MGKLIKRKESALARPVVWEDKRFVKALYGFLAGIHNENTRKAYEHALRAFFVTVNKEPVDVTRPDVATYMEMLKKAGKSPATVNLSITALNQFYEELRRPESPVADPLVKYNPVGVRRMKVDPYSRSTKITLEQFKQLRSKIDTGDIAGKRNLAIILFYVYTGRRRSEIARLKWQDIVRKKKRTTFTYVGKGGKRFTKDLNPAVIEALDDYINESGRKMKRGSPIFTPLNIEKERHLSARMIDKMVKGYAAEAGIEPDQITLHSFRHLAAEIRRQTGYSIEDVQEFLDHASVATTQIYLKKSEGGREKNAAKARKLIG
jgi:integrase/recombinase XerD